ncbi:MAG: beta strand repeat-containing protein, partial [Burkholderiales bacterium]
TLTGTSAATAVNVNGAAGTQLTLGSANRLAAGATLAIAGAGNTVLLGGNESITGFSIAGGTLGGSGTLTASNPYALNGGTVSANLGAGTVNVAGGVTTTLNGTSAATAVNVNGAAGTQLSLGSANRLAGGATLAIAGAGNTVLLGGNESIAGFSIAGGTLGGTGTLTASGPYALNGGVINADLGAGTLVQGAGLSLLNGTAGAATVNITGGTLQLGGTNRLATSAAVTLSALATLDMANNATTIGSLVGAGGTVALGSATLTTGDAANTSYAGSISGSGGLVKQGSGTFTLAAANSYTGTTAINAGTLRATNAAALGTAAAGTTVAGGAVLEVDTSGGSINLGGEAITLASTAGAGANLRVSGGNTLTLGTALSLAGGAGSQPGTIQLTSSSLNMGANSIDASSAGIERLVVASTGTTTLTVGSVGAVTALGGASIAATNINLQGNTLRSNGLVQINGAAVNNSGTALDLIVDDLDIGGSLNLSGQALNLRPLTTARTIDLGGASGGSTMGISAGDLGAITGVSTLSIGGNMQTGAINLAGSVNTTATGAATVNLQNNTGGIEFGANFTVGPAATLNVAANAGGSGAITATGGGTIFASSLNLAAAGGIGTGTLVVPGPPDLPFMAPLAPIRLGQTATVTATNSGGGGVFIQSNSSGANVDLTVGAGGITSGGGGISLQVANNIVGIGAISSGGGRVTLVAGAGGAAGGMLPQAGAAGFSAGAITFTSGGINAGAGDITLNATGPITQATGGAATGIIGAGLTVRTFNNAGAAIDLQNDAAVVGNAPSGSVILEARRADSLPTLAGDNYANGNIDFKSNTGLNLSGVGTAGNITLTAASYNIDISNVSTFQGNNVVLLANAGNIEVNTSLPNSMIRNGNPGGSLSLLAVGSININQAIGSSNASRFNHTLNLAAGNDINVNQSIWLGNDLSLQANATAGQIGAAPLPGGGGVNLNNSNASAPLEVRAQSITIGSVANPVASLSLVTGAGVAGAGINRGVLLQSDAALEINATSGLTATAGTAAGADAIAAISMRGSTVSLNLGAGININGGSATGARALAGFNVTGGSIRLIAAGNSALVAGTANGSQADAGILFEAGSVDFRIGSVPGGIGDLTLRGGTATNGGRAAALINTTASKAMVIGGNLVIQGGSADAASGAVARIDPSAPMTITVGRGLVLIAGTSPAGAPTTSAASIVNGGQINLVVNASGAGGMTSVPGIDLGAGVGVAVPSNMILVGNSGSGIYNQDLGNFLNPGPVRTAPNSVPLGYLAPPITLSGGSVVSVLNLNGVQDSAFVLSGVAGNISVVDQSTPVGIARTVIEIQDPNKTNKNRVQDNCQ